MKILLVDDIADNREMQEKLVKRFAKKYEVHCEIFHAQNGQEAVDHCKQEMMDLIFMDIVMPIMDGLEATKLIKQISPSPMIIVISSENDEATKTKILQEGAEDYILKPFSSATMISRLHNYYRLVTSRHAIGFKAQAVNAFTHNVYSYHTRFLISNEDELAQFWETLLVRLEYQNHIAKLSDYVRFLFYLGSYQLQKSYKFHIYLEEDEDHFYFSMDNMNILSKEMIQKGIKKFCDFAHYKMNENVVSFAVLRAEKNIGVMRIKEQTVVSETKIKEPVYQPKPIKKQELQTFDLLDIDSRFEFEHILAKLQTEISMMGSSSLELDDIDTIHDSVKQLVEVLVGCPDAFAISTALSNFDHLLEEHSEEFLAKSRDLADMVKAFVHDIETWKDMVFYTGAPSVNFLDDSITSSVEMIKAVFIEEDLANEEDLDDIFDF